MRKLLQNKLVVSALAGVAVLSVVANFVKLPKRLSLAVAREPSTEPAEVSPTTLHVPGETEFSRTLRAWHELYPINSAARDPFAPMIEPATMQPVAVAVAMAANPSLPPSFVLQAISIEANRPFAVINQTVVTEGEWISGYRVERILPTRVTLSGGFGSLSIDMSRASQRQKAPTANAPAADLSPAPAGQKPVTANR